MFRSSALLAAGAILGLGQPVITGTGFRRKGYGSIANKPHSHTRANARRVRQAERNAQRQAERS